VSFFQPSFLQPADVTAQAYVHVVGTTVWIDDRPADAG